MIGAVRDAVRAGIELLQPGEITESGPEVRDELGSSLPEPRSPEGSSASSRLLPGNDGLKNRLDSLRTPWDSQNLPPSRPTAATRPLQAFAGRH